MNFEALAAEIGTPLAVVVLGLIIYFKERNRGGSDAYDVPAEFKLWVTEHVKDPILTEIKELREKLR